MFVVGKSAFKLGGLVALAFLLTFSVSGSRTKTERTTTYAVLVDNTRSVEKQFPHILVVWFISCSTTALTILMHLHP